MVKGYCFKCKSQRDIVDAKIAKNKRGVNVAKGTCLKCKGKIFAFVKAGAK